MDTLFDGAPVPWDILHDSTKRSTLLSDADKFSAFKSLDPSRMSRSELYDILHLIGAEQKESHYFIEFIPDDDILVEIYPSLPVSSDDEIMELPDPSVVTAKFNHGKRTYGTRVKRIIDSDDDSESSPELPDFSPAIVVPSMPTPPSTIFQPDSDTTVTVSTKSTVSAPENAVTPPTTFQPELPDTTVSVSAESTVSTAPTVSAPENAVTPPTFQPPGENATALKANKRKGSKLKRKVADKQDSDDKQPKYKKPRVTNPPAPVEPVRSSSRSVIVEF